ncbi:hypothetical protein H8D29_06985 [PVC group bacterium]|nr:hypothetical protein [PVC group bacterium]
MAIRSGAGTGVIVSLVVFVLTTVFLLVLCIVFYTGKNKQLEETTKVENALNSFVTPEEESRDSFQRVVAEAKASRRSVSGYLNSELESLRKLVLGDPSASQEQIKSSFADSISKGGSLKLAFDNLSRQLLERQQELDSRVIELENARTQINNMQQIIDNSVSSNDQTVAAAKTQWQDIHDESALLAQNTDTHFSTRTQRDNRLTLGMKTQIEQLVLERNSLLTDKTLLASTTADLREIINSSRMSSADPATLVDGLVLDAVGTDRVFIDRGSNDRIVLGMSFEIYDDATQLRVNKDGELPRGKASIEIIKVGKTTSTAKVTQATPGRPIVRDNIIVNAIYDPDYRYKFMVHGVFDADGDGLPERNH